MPIDAQLRQIPLSAGRSAVAYWRGTARSAEGDMLYGIYYPGTIVALLYFPVIVEEAVVTQRSVIVVWVARRKMRCRT